MQDLSVGPYRIAPVQVGAAVERAVIQCKTATYVLPRWEKLHITVIASSKQILKIHVTQSPLLPIHWTHSVASGMQSSWEDLAIGCSRRPNLLQSPFYSIAWIETCFNSPAGTANVAMLIIKQKEVSGWLLVSSQILTPVFYFSASIPTILAAMFPWVCFIYLLCLYLPTLAANLAASGRPTNY